MVSIEQPPLSRLMCPLERSRYNKAFYLKEINGKEFLVVDSLYYVLNTKDENSSHSRHHLKPLYWCNNKESEDYSWCLVCQCTQFATTYYFCNECDRIYHKECVESPHAIRSLNHPKHDLQLLMYYGFKEDAEEIFCYYCKSTLYYPKLIYYCFICEFSLDPVCARRPPFLNYQKRHEHTLYHSTRKVDMVCDVCGEVDKKSLIFVCLECDFVVHNGCIYLPFVIRISRHEHRLYFTYSPLTKLSCGVCRKKVDENYGKYSCMKGCAYVVHSRCATRKDVWDGKELEEEPEEVYENLNSFEVIGDKIIQHFSHSHHMRFEKEAADIMYDGEKRCRACVLPLYRGGVYKCVNAKCDFVLHEKCASLPRKKQHMAYRYPLTLQVSDTKTYFYCYAVNLDDLKHAQCAEEKIFEL